MTGGTGVKGAVLGGRRVEFTTKQGRQYAQEIALDEHNHVAFLRAAPGGARVSRPAIDIQNSFTAAARAAGLITGAQTFDPYANENTSCWSRSPPTWPSCRRRGRPVPAVRHPAADRRRDHAVASFAVLACRPAATARSSARSDSCC